MQDDAEEISSQLTDIVCTAMFDKLADKNGNPRLK
jgi:hypothetical protein